MGCQLSSNQQVSTPTPKETAEQLIPLPQNSVNETHSLSTVPSLLHTSSSKRFLANMVPEQIGKDIRNFYQIDNTNVLGFGASGVVKECIHINSKRKYALKTIQKSSLRADSIKRLQIEIQIMQEVDHPNILRLHEVFEDDEKIYLISELCTGGNLCDKLQDLDDNRNGAGAGPGLDETSACAYIYSIVSAVKYLHAHNIIHRDLKLDNFLLEDSEPKAALKLTDFGVSRHLSEQETTTGRVGTPYYVAPEVISGQAYNNRCDVWSIGVCAYLLLFGEPPFPGESVNDTKPLILANKPKYIHDDNDNADSTAATAATEEEIRDSSNTDDNNVEETNNIHINSSSPREPSAVPKVSREAKAFIRRCLTSDANDRLSADALLTDDWFSSVVRVDGGKGLSIVHIHEFDADPHAFDKVADFKRKTALSRFCIEVLVYSLPSSCTEVRKLRTEFMRYDLDNDGEISKEDFKAVVDQLQITKRTSSCEGTVNNVADELFATINFTNTGRIIYHEFLAAMLDLSKVSDDAFRAAFDLIAGGKRYFDIDDVVRMLGIDSTFEQVAKMLKDAKFETNSRITFATFCKLLRDMSSQYSVVSSTSAEFSLEVLQNIKA